MKALICSEFGNLESLQVTEVPEPTPAQDEVVIKVQAVGLNFPDLLMLQNKYQFKPELPYVPGGEFSGIVESVGSQVQNFKKGDRVCALNKWGGLAERCSVKSTQVFHLPSSTNFIDGAITMYAYGTSYHALKDRAELKKGETILILGASGGVGLAAVDLSKIMGATVIAAAASEDKLQACKDKGADYLINYSSDDIRSKLKDITQGKGVDVVYDAVGGLHAETALRSLAWNGRYLVVGFASGTIPSFPANIPLLKGASIVGVFLSGFIQKEPVKGEANFKQIVDWLSKGVIRNSIHTTYHFSESKQAFADLLNRKVIGKAVVLMQ